MINNRPGFKLLIIFQAVVFLALAVGESQAAKKKNKKDPAYVMTEAELQSQVMAFADRYSAVISSASREYSARAPAATNRRLIFSQLVYSLADAFTIAAGPDPDAAFLDMIVMVTLGRMVFEEHYVKKFGSEVEPLVKAFQTAERDIWQIADRVLTEKQQKELMSLIRDWRRNHPDVVVFSLVRFSDFESGRKQSGASKSKTSGGLFQSVKKATAQVEEARLLAERGMYLGTRMPLLTGAFANVWVSSLTVNPEVKNILTDLHQISEVSERLANTADDLPHIIATERQAAIKNVMRAVAVERQSAINQLVDRISKERQQTINHIVEKVASERRRTIEEFVAEEKRMRGLLTDLKQTLNSGNDLLTSANTLVERFDPEQADTETTTPSRPFDIKDYQTTLVEASSVIQQLHGLVMTIDQMGLERSLPQIINTFEQVEKQGENWVVFAFFLGIVLIALFLVGSVMAMLTYRYFSRRFFEPSQEQSGS